MVTGTDFMTRGFEFVNKLLPMFFIGGSALILMLWLISADGSVEEDGVAGIVAFSGWLVAMVFWLRHHEAYQKTLLLHHSRQTLAKENSLLEQHVKRQALALDEARADATEQLYRVAQLGQAGITLLHDVANQLSVLTLAAEGLEQASPEAERIKKVASYLEEVMEATRRQLQGETKVQSFEMIACINDVLSLLRHQAAKHGVGVEWYSRIKTLHYTGDVSQFSQMLAYIIQNAIDAYDGLARQDNATVIVSLKIVDNSLRISVLDHGKGIVLSARESIFRPFHSTKATGLGIGLFIAKQIIETSFGGTIELTPAYNQTEFVITLPFCKEEYV